MISLGRWPKVETLREKLNGKAKAEPNFRFYLLHDKLYRKDVLEAAYAQCRQNGGACGVDGVTFEQLEAQGVAGFLDELSRELKTETYAPSAVKRVLIPKAGKPGEFRPLGIPTIKDRVVQQAAKLLLEPIFEADLPDNAYGYRPGKSAHDAVKAVHQGLKDGHLEVVDADLSKYFDTIPHDQLMRSVERRIVDRRMLSLIRGWLKAPVHVRDEKTGKVRIEGGQNTKVGTPQGGVISPLLANIYFRRVLRAWDENGYGRKLCARIVNYADDFVILTRNRAREALEKAGGILRRIGLTLNDRKTRICQAPEGTGREMAGTESDFPASPRARPELSGWDRPTDKPSAVRTEWKAGCGKSARPVWEAGKGNEVCESLHTPAPFLDFIAIRG